MLHLVSLPSLLCRTASKLSNLLWWKLVSSLSKRFASGRYTSAWHSGQRNFPFLWLISACFFKHSQQNVCRQVIVLGSVKVSRQIEQVTCSLRVFSRDSIVKSCFTVTKCTFLKFRFCCDYGILDLYIGLEKNSFIYPWLSNRIFRSLPSHGAEMFIVIFKGAFS